MTIYHCSANESFDSIAGSWYGDEKYAAQIISANPEYDHKIVFDGGENIYLPEIEIPESSEEARLANTIAPWKTQ
ncbi:MAG: hypothetical protein IJ234_08640 [Clostridia bacterium]|nr:hypothetical protein [Clostridia bacterium]